MCSCLPNYLGRPPQCRPECVVNSDCAINMACVNERCKNPCPGSCGPNAECRVASHAPYCQCLNGYTGDPFNGCVKVVAAVQSKQTFHTFTLNQKTNNTNFSYTIFLHTLYSLLYLYNVSKIIFSTVYEPPSDPCNPTPCGVNAVCKEHHGAGSCQCLPEYFGDPYLGCRPECVMNSDCPKSRACVNQKCVDPCPGACGLNAECHTSNHAPTCVCLPGYIGDPSRSCHLPPPSKIINISLSYCFAYAFA